MIVNAHRFVIMAIFLSLLAGCAFFPKEPSIADPRSVYVWPLEACPSSPGVTAKPAFVAPGVVAGLATPLLTDLVNGLVGLPVAAIQNAAAADAAGFKANGQNPRLYFRNVAIDPNTKLPQFTPPGCYVVAYTKFMSPASVGPAGDWSAKDWCDDTAFSASLPQACNEGGKKILATFANKHDAEGLPAAIPDFYAEIQLFPSNYEGSGGRVVRPRVVALHYPKSLIEPKSAKPRLLTLSLNLASPGSTANDSMKPASLSIVLQGVTPSPVISEDLLTSQQTSWIAMPTSVPAAAAGAPQPQGGAPYYPVNISAALSEVGDPSVFLQAFAKAVAGSAADYSKAIVNAIPPVPTAATEQQSTSAKATLQSAVAQAESDKAKYLTSCTPAPTTAAAKAAANGAYQTVLADRLKANAAALGITTSYGTASSPAPYDPIDEGLTKCF